MMGGMTVLGNGKRGGGASGWGRGRTRGVPDAAQLMASVSMYAGLGGVSHALGHVAPRVHRQPSWPGAVRSR